MQRQYFYPMEGGCGVGGCFLRDGGCSQLPKSDESSLGLYQKNKKEAICQNAYVCYSSSWGFEVNLRSVVALSLLITLLPHSLLAWPLSCFTQNPWGRWLGKYLWWRLLLAYWGWVRYWSCCHADFASSILYALYILSPSCPTTPLWEY